MWETPLLSEAGVGMDGLMSGTQGSSIDSPPPKGLEVEQQCGGVEEWELGELGAIDVRETLSWKVLRLTRQCTNWPTRINYLVQVAQNGITAKVVISVQIQTSKKKKTAAE